jgi:hypothetical protein
VKFHSGIIDKANAVLGKHASYFFEDPEALNAVLLAAQFFPDQDIPMEMYARLFSGEMIRRVQRRVKCKWIYEELNRRYHEDLLAQSDKNRIPSQWGKRIEENQPWDWRWIHD